MKRSVLAAALALACALSLAAPAFAAEKAPLPRGRLQDDRRRQGL